MGHATDWLERRALTLVAGATALIGIFSVFTIILGYAAISLLADRSEILGPDGRLIGGSDMAVLYLAQVLGGDLFFGFCPDAGARNRAV